MNSFLPFRIGLLAGFSFFLFTSAPRSEAAPAPKAFVTVVFAGGSSIKIASQNELFRPVDLRPGETVTVRAQVPKQFGNNPAFVQALDGGAVSDGVTIASDGTASIAFRAGSGPGLYRVLLSARGRMAMLQFIVREEPS